MEQIVIYLPMVQKLLNLKQNVSKDFSIVNMKKIGLNGYVYDFSVDYDAFAVDGILDIQKYLMEKNNTIYNVFIIKCFFTTMISFSCNVLNVMYCNWSYVIHDS